MKDRLVPVLRSVYLAYSAVHLFLESRNSCSTRRGLRRQKELGKDHTALRHEIKIAEDDPPQAYLNAAPESGKDAFHRVPDFGLNKWDAVERVLTIPGSQ